MSVYIHKITQFFHIIYYSKSGNFITKDKVKQLNVEGKVEKNLDNPPLKDTVVVPDAGFTVIRFVANNPGFWLFHCHLSWHDRIGMGLILQVRLSNLKF